MEPEIKAAPVPTPEPPPWPTSGIRTGLVSGVFCLLLLVLLVINHLQAKASDPLDNKDLAKLKSALVLKPSDKALQQQVRALDLDLRQKHFKHVALGQFGGWLLLGGAIVFLASYKPATAPKKMPKPPKRSAEDYARELVQTRWAVSAFGALALGGAWLLSATASTSLVQKTDSASSAKNPTALAATPVPKLAAFPTQEELNANWQRFRGPQGAGRSAYTNLPITWNVTNGDNILWKTEIPLVGRRRTA